MTPPGGGGGSSLWRPKKKTAGGKSLSAGNPTLPHRPLVLDPSQMKIAGGSRGSTESGWLAPLPAAGLNPPPSPPLGGGGSLGSLGSLGGVPSVLRKTLRSTHQHSQPSLLPETPPSTPDWITPSSNAGVSMVSRLPHINPGESRGYLSQNPSRPPGRSTRCVDQIGM